MTEFCVHVGAHKTATTWLQSRLAAGRGELARRGIGYKPLLELRADFTVPFSAWVRDRGEERGEEQMAVLQSRLAQYRNLGERRFIISDENIIGSCNDIMRTGRLYGGARRRLAGLLDLLGERPACAVLTVRSYAPFFASAYCESLWHGAFRPFRRFQNHLVQDDGLWVRVVEEMVSVFGPDRVRVMRFEQLNQRLAVLIEALCGVPIDPALLPDSPERRESLSAAAVDALAQVAAQSGPGATRAAVAGIAARFPRSAAFPGFDPWKGARKARLDALYAEHLEEIGRRWPGVLL